MVSSRPASEFDRPGIPHRLHRLASDGDAANDREWNLLMLDWTTCLAVEHDPEKLSGAWVFRGSRVPVCALFENLESGATLDQFLTCFPGVTRAQAKSVPEHAARSLQTA